MLKKAGKILGIIILILLVIILITLRIMDFRWSDKKYTAKFDKKQVSFASNSIQIDQRQIHYLETGDTAYQPVMFIHGAPGSLRDFKSYLWDVDLLQKINMRAVDRPGYGYSGYGQPERSIQKQADLIQQVMEDSSVVIGHSYGGPVAAAIAMNYPEKVKHLILLAPAVDPQHEKQFVPKVLGKAPFKYLFSRAIQVAFEEKFAHEAALEDLLPDWNKITCPVTVVHGRNDHIVPFENMAFLKQKLDDNSEFLPVDDMNHIMIWSDFEFVKNLILESLE